jgi:ADP-ribose pyrophosphatase YjhB (NUDIX family)
MNNVKYNEEDVSNHHGIAAVIKNESGEVLMQEHVKYGFWTIPVGKVLPGQVVEDGLKQEVLEECGIAVEKLEEISVRKYNYNRNGEEVEVLLHLFNILKYTGEVRNNEPEKHKQQKFLSIEEIKNIKYLSDSTLLYLETLGIGRGSSI